MRSFAGTGSDKTAVLSIISLTGAGLLPFNVSKGGGFQAALGRVLGEDQSSRRETSPCLTWLFHTLTRSASQVSLVDPS